MVHFWHPERNMLKIFFGLQIWNIEHPYYWRQEKNLHETQQLPQNNISI